MVSAPLPVPYWLIQPRPLPCTGQPSGSGPTSSGLPAPCVLPKVWPPAMSATVSSSVMPMRLKVTRMSWAEATRVGLALRALGVDVDQAHGDGGEVALLEVERGRRRRSARRRARCPPGPQKTSWGCQVSSRPKAKPNVFRPMSSWATLPASTSRSAQESVAAVLLLDRQQQAAGLVQVGVVRPAVERGEALRALAAATAAVGDAVGAGRVPRHADEQRAVVAPVGRPPVLRGAHDLGDVALELPRRRASRTAAW